MSYDKLFDTEEITIEDRKTGKEKIVIQKIDTKRYK